MWSYSSAYSKSRLLGFLRRFFSERDPEKKDQKKDPEKYVQVQSSENSKKGWDGILHNSLVLLLLVSNESNKWYPQNFKEHSPDA